jgi:multiple sugar transport system substrate-binding protein
MVKGFVRGWPWVWPESGRQRLATVLAALVAVPSTFFVLQAVTGSASSRPALDGCGTHEGLVIAADADVSFSAQRRDRVKDWNDQHGPDLQARMVEVGPTIDALHSQVVAAAQTHSCAYDVYVLDTPWTAEFAERHAIEKVSPEWMEDPGDVIPDILATGKWHGVQYAVPWTTDAGLLYRRAGTNPPGSWDELLRSGYAAQLADYEGLTVNALEAVWNITNRTVLSGPVDHVSDDDSKLILSALSRLRRSSGVTASRAWDETAATEAFAGRGGQPPPPTFMRNWPYVFRVLTADPRVGSAFDVSPLPTPSFSVLGGQNLAVSAYSNSKHKEAAGQLINFLTGKKAEEYLFTCGGYPPTRLAALGTKCGRPDQPPSTDPDVPSPQRLGQLATSLRAALVGARPRPATPYYGQFSEAFRGCVNNALFTDQPPHPATLARVLNAALKGRQSGC